MKTLKLTLEVIAAWIIASLAMYLFGASFASFVEMRNMFDVAEWDKYARLLLAWVSTASLATFCYLAFKS
jgi:hypothetical protein